MPVTPDTFHVPIGPWGLSGQSPSGVDFRHVSTALLRSVEVCGENVLKVRRHAANESSRLEIIKGGITNKCLLIGDPGEAVNILFLLAFVLAQAVPQSF